MDTDWPTLLPVLLQSVQETLVMVTATIVLSGIAGLIIGAALYASRPGNLFEQPVVFGILNVIVNIVRPIPFIIFITAIGPLTLLVVGTTIGTAAAILPMTLMASVVMS